MKTGISTDKKTGPDATCLATKGIQVVLRYYSQSSWKRLAASEAQLLCAAGIELGMFYEDNPTKVSYFTGARGLADGGAACAYAAKLGQPSGSCIYFTVDFDAEAADLPSLVAYFEGVATAMATAATGGHPSYVVGVYGSGKVCTEIKQREALASFSCLAESTSWGGSKNYKGWDILQKLGTATLCSLKGPLGKNEADYEACDLRDEFGGFILAPKVGSKAASSAALARSASLSEGSNFTQRLLQTAEEQWLFFDKQKYDLSGHIVHVGRKEGQEGCYERVGEYWLEGTNTYGVDGRNHEMPWSAAFISWVAKKAGAGDRFRYSTQHSVYISQSIRDRLSTRVAAGYWGWRLNEAKPTPGDIVCWSRQAGIDYEHQNGGDYQGHCDFVVEIHANYLLITGGNVGDSVTTRPIPLDKDGYILPSHHGSEYLFALMKNRIDQ